MLRALYVREKRIPTSQCATDIEASLFMSGRAYQSQETMAESLVSNVAYYS